MSSQPQSQTLGLLYLTCAHLAHSHYSIIPHGHFITVLSIPNVYYLHTQCLLMLRHFTDFMDFLLLVLCYFSGINLLMNYLQDLWIYFSDLSNYFPLMEG